MAAYMGAVLTNVGTPEPLQIILAQAHAVHPPPDGPAKHIFDAIRTLDILAPGTPGRSLAGNRPDSSM